MFQVPKGNTTFIYFFKTFNTAYQAGLSYFTAQNDFYNLTCKLRIFTCKIVKNVLKSADQLPKQK